MMEPDSSATDNLDKEDRTALDQVTGSANQGAASVSPTAGAASAAPAVTQSTMFAGHILALADAFFVRRFGPENGIPEALRSAIQADVAAALDAYFPNVETKPGIFAALALGGHFIACQRAAKADAKPPASSDNQAAEKPRSASDSLQATGV